MSINPATHPQGRFSTHVSEGESRAMSYKLFKSLFALRNNGHLPRFRYEDINKDSAAVDVFTALKSGAPLSITPAEIALIEYENALKTYPKLAATAYNDAIKNIYLNFTNERKRFLEKFIQDDGHYDLSEFGKALKKDFAKSIQSDLNQNGLKAGLKVLREEKSAELFNQSAEYPETLRRLVAALDIPEQNDKGWNLTAQASRAGHSKLAEGFEKAGFGPDLHAKAMVNFAHAMTGHTDAQKSKALKELLGAIPLS
ncbi:hypothetical protein [Vampirovibrio sp.]|uniref:hypothetical protein n=1 Tax=Vampirovibrio sp. TaxID=2717857 RepID=UPI0035946F98